MSKVRTKRPMYRTFKTLLGHDWVMENNAIVISCYWAIWILYISLALFLAFLTGGGIYGMWIHFQHKIQP